MEGATMDNKIYSDHSVTDNDVINILVADKGKDAKLISWKLVRFTKTGDGYVSLVCSVEVKYNQNGQELQASYVVKLMHDKVVDNSREFVQVLFQKEARFYLELIPELNGVLKEIGEQPLNFPKCYSSDLTAGKERIFFEDLRTRGFILFDRRKGLDVPHVNLVVQELARLHAASLLLQSKYHEPLEVKHDYLLKDWFTFTDNAEEPMKTMILQSFETAIQILDKMGGYERIVKWIESLKPKLIELYSSGLKSPNYDVVCHGDCWNNNLLFRYDENDHPVEVMLIDVQICRKASPTCDLNEFFFVSTDIDIRKSNLNNFLNSYYKTFKKVIDAGQLNMPFSEQELFSEFRNKNTMGSVFGLFILPIVLLESDDSVDMEANGVDFHELMKDVKDKTDLLLTNPMFKQRFLGIFDELMETGIIP